MTDFYAAVQLKGGEKQSFRINDIEGDNGHEDARQGVIQHFGDKIERVLVCVTTQPRPAEPEEKNTA